MNVLSEEQKMIISDINTIYKPKLKRAYKSKAQSSPVPHFININLRNGKKKKMNKKEHLYLNLNKNGISKSQNLNQFQLKKL